MGQQVASAESPEDVKNQASPRWCRDNATDLPKANRATDSVRISRNFQARAGLCSGALPLGPDVLVTDVTGRSAKVYWSINEVEEARKIHLEVLLDQGVGMSEVAFFEVGGSQSSWELPEGTLQKGCGPYQVQLVLESGPEGAPRLTKPSRSEFFWAAEAPSQVAVTLTEVECESFTVAWGLPEEDGGVAIGAFEVQLQCAKDEGAEVCSKGAQLMLDADARSSNFCGFQPGSGPHFVKVRAQNLAKLWSPWSEVQVFTAYLAPGAPSELSARLLPGWARRLGPLSFAEAGQSDTDVVKLQFVSPSHNGGHSIESYIIHAEEEVSEASMEKPGPKMRVLEVASSSLTEETRPGGGVLCSCHVAVEPNRTYIFTVEASNGRRGPLSAPSAPVFAPARVPQAPEAPQVFAAQGTLAADLRWSCLASAGGLPVEGFKIGVAMDTGHTPELHREVSYALAAVTEPRVDEVGPLTCKTRLEGLMPNARYSFMLATCNGAGTSRWSPLSAFLQTPAAPPQTPVNTVATIAQDAEQQVVVSISWECPPELPGSASVCGFDLQMLPVEMQQVRPSSDRRLVRERIATPNAKPGDRICWAKALTAPGCYVIEISAESNGQRSPPAVLTLEARPEAFPPSLAELMVAPKWSEEPYLALGPAAENVHRFGSLEGTWLQTLLLWGEPAGTVEKSARTFPSSIDVLCFFRRPGSSQVFKAMLASEVTTSRLQVALPTHVPMSLRLVVKLDPKSAARTPRPPMSEPLAIMFNDDGEPLQPNWEIWSRNNPDGQPARWTSIPEELQHCIEAAWLEGHQKVNLQLPHATEGRMAPGHYELTFGDERQTQSTVKKLGPGGWTAKARRSVLSNDEGTLAAAASTDELCVICMERRRTHAFMHADTGDGHLAVCVDCAEAYRAEAAVPGGTRAVRTCPMCRRGFTALQRIYQ